MAESRNWEEVYTAQSQAIERLTRERDHLRERLALAREETLEEVLQALREQDAHHGPETDISPAICMVESMRKAQPEEGK